MKVRMKRFVPQFVHVMDLQNGEVYEIADERAQQLIDNEMAEAVGRDADRLEAAALRSAQRRG